MNPPPPPLPGPVRSPFLPPWIQSRWTILIFLAILSGWLALRFGPVSLRESLLSLLPPCWFHQHSGLLCPGCGGTRALSATLQGDWWLAFRSNPILPLGLGMIFLESTKSARIRFKNDPATHLRVFVFAQKLFLVLILAFAVGRNLPFWPAWLTP
jgi:hypothetical protein